MYTQILLPFGAIVTLAACLAGDPQQRPNPSAPADPAGPMPTRALAAPTAEDPAPAHRDFATEALMALLAEQIASLPPSPPQLPQLPSPIEILGPCEEPPQPLELHCRCMPGDRSLSNHAH